MAKKRGSNITVNNGPSVNNRPSDQALQKLLNEIHVLSSSVISRTELMSRYGDQNGGNRNIFYACGYKFDLSYDDFYSRYKRQDIAKRFINAPVNATWRLKPEVYDDEDEAVTSAFEKKWQELVKRLRVWHYFARADKLAGIGQHSVLFLGFNDGMNLDQEVSRGTGRDLLYLFPYGENSIDFQEYNKDKTNPRYGLPEKYIITMNDITLTSTNTATVNEIVHYSRLLHIVQEPMESDINGTPQLEDIWNRLHDIEKIVGGSGEMFWLGGFPGYAFVADSDTQLDTGERDDLVDQIQLYMHKIMRFLRLRGMRVDSLAPQVSDPTNHVMINLKLAAGTKGIPVRILIGSERGELASTQDDDNWNDRIDERRTDYGENVILRPFIDRLINYGVLPEPKGGEYQIDWPDIAAPSDKEKADVSRVRMEALKAYLTAPGATETYSIETFLAREMDLSQEEIKEQMKDIREYLEQEEEQAKQYQQQMQQQNGGGDKNNPEDLDDDNGE